MNSTPLQCIAHLLASQFVKAYGEAERTGRQIEEVGRLDLLVAVARQVLSEVGREEDAAARVPAWRVAADAHTTCEFARMAQMEIMKSGADTTVVEVCDYVTGAVHAFEAEYRAVAWNEDGAPDWTEATETFWQQYTAAHAPPWIDDVEEARRECEAEALRTELRRLGYNVTGLDGRVEIRDTQTGALNLAMECRGDGTCDVQNYAAHRYETAVPIATMITYARLMVRA
jgi:hypothetical protein